LTLILPEAFHAFPRPIHKQRTELTAI
jgi:hypothetical protein